MDFIEYINFNSDIDDDGNFISYAQLKFPYFSPEDEGGRVYFKTDKELDKKMRNLREISRKDILMLGKQVVRTYNLNNKMTLKDFKTLFEINNSQKSTLGIDNKD